MVSASFNFMYSAQVAGIARVSRVLSAGTLPVLAVAAGWLIATVSPAEAQTDRDNKKTVAVLYFDYTGDSQDFEYLRKALAQMLIADLTGTPGITIVERTRLEEVYAELDLAGGRRIDKKTALKLGKLLNAHYLIFGGYFFDGDGRMYVTGRVTHPETGEVIAGTHERREGEAFWELEQHLASELRQILRTKVVAFADDKAREERVASKRRKRSKRAREQGEQGTGAETTVASKSAVAGDADKAIPAAGAGGHGAAGAPPNKLTASTAIRYGKALDAIDRGDKAAARAGLKAVVKDSPDFDLAAIDLASMAK